MAYILTPDSASVRKPAGALIVDGSQQADTVQCVHCNCHWEVVPGSGRKRTFCFNCMGVTCGGQSCVTRCIPFEKKLEMREKQGKGVRLR